MQKKVAFIGIKGLPSKAGADRVVEAVVRGVDKEKYHPVVYCSKRDVDPSVTIPGVTLLRMPSLPGKHLHALTLFIVSALHAFFLGRYDFVHMHNVEACFVSPLLRLRYKIIATSHGSAQARDKWGTVAKRLIQLTEYPYIYFSNILTSVGQPLADYYRRQYGREMHYLPNGVDDDIPVSHEKAKAILDKHGLRPGSYVMFAAGRVIPTKGCHLLLEAIRELDEDIPVLVAGDISQLPAYTEKLKALAGEQVKFCGFIGSKETLFGLVSQARLFVFPSTVEAMSMMLLEVASLQTPVVCSDIPENTSIMPESTRFFASKDAQDLQRVLQEALAAPEAMCAEAEVARLWVNQKYRWPTITVGYEKLYQQLV